MTAACQSSSAHKRLRALVSPSLHLRRRALIRPRITFIEPSNHRNPGVILAGSGGEALRLFPFWRRLQRRAPRVRPSEYSTAWGKKRRAHRTGARSTLPSIGSPGRTGCRPQI
eukprot:865892-Pyramimonas_sp.AAC.3